LPCVHKISIIANSMKYYNERHSCCNCKGDIDLKVFEYSSDHFGVALCRTCQKWFKEKMDATTPETIQLYFSLKERGVPALKSTERITILVPSKHSLI